MGSIFRTANAAGVSNIILSGYTPLPIDRFKQKRKEFLKVSLGAEKTIVWSHTTKLLRVLQTLKKEGYEIIALEQHTQSIPLFKWKKPNRPLVLILGNEVRGVSSQVLSKVDTILEIPMQGSKESLNVSVAAGIALFSILNPSDI